MCKHNWAAKSTLERAIWKCNSTLADSCYLHVGCKGGIWGPEREQEKKGSKH